jgi:hypothetical protein
MLHLHFTSIFIFHLMLLPSNQSSVGFAASSFSKEPARCGGDEGALQKKILQCALFYFL